MTDAQKIIEDLLNQHTPVVFRAGGPSMNPTIRDGESVRIRPLQAHDPRLGTLVLVRKNGRLVLHRLIRRDVQTGALYLVADAAVSGGEWVAAADLLGVCEWVQRHARRYRLEGTPHRLAGWLRYALRPLRRTLALLRPAHHAHTPANRS